MTLNLIEDRWMPVRRRGGNTEKITPWEISLGLEDDPIIGATAPRADFKGAIYQFLIGLLQTAFAPEDEEDWEEYWVNPPTSESLRKAFEAYRDAFEIDANGPAFMQDFDLPEGEAKGIAALLIEAPGGKTLRDNLAHFVKDGLVVRMSPHWAALALFTLQINAPSGGAGHRTGLRGGGPLTTLILPPEHTHHDSLWHKLWLNVLTQEDMVNLAEGAITNNPAAIFPWLAPTRTSERKGGETYPVNGHPLQMYWPMPRRIRLVVKNNTAGVCDLSGEQSDTLVTIFRTKNYGVNYEGDWRHPFTPYSVDPAKGALSLKPQPGGISYRHWLGLVLEDDQNHKQPAKVVQIYNDRRRKLIRGDFQPLLWAFGYDMDNMKARCWYESTLPVYAIPQILRQQIQYRVALMIGASAEVVKNLRHAIKTAWFSRPEKAKGDLSFLDFSFWQSTEAAFYRTVKINLQALERDRNAEPSLCDWKTTVSRQALTLFDHYALSSGNVDGDLKRIVKARSELEKWLRSGKQIRKLAA